MNVATHEKSPFTAVIATRLAGGATHLHLCAMSSTAQTVAKLVAHARSREMYILDSVVATYGGEALYSVAYEV